MADSRDDLNELFAIPPITELSPDVLGEMQSILRIHSLSPTELSYKWESYTMKMGTEQTKLDLDTARAFKKDLQEMLERDSRGKTHHRSADKRGAHATPKNVAKGDDVFGMYVGSRTDFRVTLIGSRLEGVVPDTPLQRRSTNGSVKRKSTFETPAVPKFNKAVGMSSPADVRANGNADGVQ